MRIVDAIMALFKLIVWGAAGCGMLMATIALLWAMIWIINKARRHFNRKW